MFEVAVENLRCLAGQDVLERLLVEGRDLARRESMKVGQR